MNKQLRQTSPRIAGDPPDDGVIEACRRLSAEIGAYTAARELGVSGETFARACAGMNMYSSTRQRLRAALEARGLL